MKRILISTAAGAGVGVGILLIFFCITANTNHPPRWFEMVGEVLFNPSGWFANWLLHGEDNLFLTPLFVALGVIVEWAVIGLIVGVVWDYRWKQNVQAAANRNWFNRQSPAPPSK